ncbi:hypothetical protein ACLK16_12205 [Escherichia coli]
MISYSTGTSGAGADVEKVRVRRPSWPRPSVPTNHRRPVAV